MNTPRQTLPRDLAVKYALWRSWKTVGDTMWAIMGDYDADGKRPSRNAQPPKP